MKKIRFVLGAVFIFLVLAKSAWAVVYAEIEGSYLYFPKSEEQIGSRLAEQLPDMLSFLSIRGLSIKPEFASKIFDGSKKYEYRRVIFKSQEVSRVVVYASDPIKQIIGEFDIERILHEEPQSLWVKTRQYAGISRGRFFDYFADKSKGYAIKIKAARVYANPLLLSRFTISSPPQSYMYLR